MEQDATDLYAQALLREYMARKGYRETLAKFDQESPRNETTITNRSTIANDLHILKLVKKNKERETPYVTMLEMIADHLRHTRIESPAPPPPTKTMAPSPSGALSAPLSASLAPSQTQPSVKLVPPLTRSTTQITSTMSDLAVEDFDESEFDRERNVPATKSTAFGAITTSSTRKFNLNPLSLEDVRGLRALILGVRSLPEEWRQGFVFSDLPNLRFGITQFKGGPCGALAAVQSYIVRSLRSSGLFEQQLLNPSSSQRQAALTSAITDILWLARSPSVRGVSRVPGRGGDPFSSWGSVDLTTRFEVEAFVDSNVVSWMEPRSDGLMCVIASVILSRGIDNVKRDMDMPDAPLIAQHGYASLDMWNLMTQGRAWTNVFDGDKVLSDDSGQTSDRMVLHGVPHRAQIGLLTLYEHYKSLEVGSNLKVPHCPIWTICSESHFTVLFSVERESTLTLPSAPRRFDLYFYDGLGCMDDVVRLTVDMDKRFEEPSLPSPLEQTIRTKWTNAAIDWNGAERLLKQTTFRNWKILVVNFDGYADGGQLLSEEEYEKFKQKMAVVRQNRIYVSYRCKSTGIDCKSIGPQSKCFCGHRYKDHATDNYKDLNIHCRAKGCRYGVWICKCTCKHPATDHHEAGAHTCKRCTCGSFFSAWSCSCGQPWSDHHTVFETKTDRERSGRPVDNLGGGGVGYAAMGGLTNFSSMVDGVDRKEPEPQQIAYEDGVYFPTQGKMTQQDEFAIYEQKYKKPSGFAGRAAVPSRSAAPMRSTIRAGPQQPRIEEMDDDNDDRGVEQDYHKFDERTTHSSKPVSSPFDLMQKKHTLGSAPPPPVSRSDSFPSRTALPTRARIPPPVSSHPSTASKAPLESLTPAQAYARKKQEAMEKAAAIKEARLAQQRQQQGGDGY